MQTNYGTFMDAFIENYKEMLSLIIQARIASDRVDAWQKSLNGVVNPEPIRSRLPKVINCQSIINGTFEFDDIGLEGTEYYEKYL